MDDITLQPTYVRWLNLLSVLRKMSPVSMLTADESILLDDLMVRWEQPQNVKVSEMMRDHGRGSGVTIYRRLISLEQKSLVKLQSDPQDKRVKYVLPTSQAALHIQRLKLGLASLVAAERSV